MDNERDAARPELTPEARSGLDKRGAARMGMRAAPETDSWRAGYPLSAACAAASRAIGTR